MRKRKILLICMAFIMMASLFAACSGGKDANTQPNNTPGTTNGGNNGDGSLEPVTFTYFNFQNRAQDKMASDTTIGKILQDQTGVDWKIEYLVGDAETKSGVMMAGGDYPDVIGLDGQYEKFLDAGALLPLDDLIEQHGPNIKRVYEPYFDLMRHSDGHIYILPYSANVGYISEPEIGQGAFWIQRSVLKEFGYPFVTTLDEYFDLIRQYIQKYPTTEDGASRIGFAIYAPTGNFFTVTNASNHLAGYPNDGDVMIDMETYEAKMYAGSEWEKRWVKALNELNAEGLFDPETFTMDQDQFIEKMTTGRLLGYFAYGWQVGEATNVLRTGPDELRYAPLPVTFEEGIKDQYIDPPSFVANRGVALSVKAKDPVRIIQYFDNMLKEENQKLIQWGIEGENYLVDENGRFYMTKEQLDNRNDNQFKEKFGWMDFEYGWPRYGNNSVFEDGNAFAVGNQPEIFQMGLTDGDKALLEAFGAETFSGYFSDPDDRPWYPAWSFTIEQGSPEQLVKKQVEELQLEYVTQMVLANPADFEGLWERYTQELSRLDIARYEQFMTEEVKKRLD